MFSLNSLCKLTFSLPIWTASLSGYYPDIVNNFSSDIRLQFRTTYPALLITTERLIQILRYFSDVFLKFSAHPAQIPVNSAKLSTHFAAKFQDEWSTFCFLFNSTYQGFIYNFTSFHPRTHLGKMIGSLRKVFGHDSCVEADAASRKRCIPQKNVESWTQDADR